MIILFLKKLSYDLEPCYLAVPGNSICFFQDLVARVDWDYVFRLRIFFDDWDCVFWSAFRFLHPYFRVRFFVLQCFFSIPFAFILMTKWLHCFLKKRHMFWNLVSCNLAVPGNSICFFQDLVARVDWDYFFRLRIFCWRLGFILRVSVWWFEP